MSDLHTFKEAVEYRRAIRKFTQEGYDYSVTKKSLENALLAPSSSNMQLYQFYRISNENLKKEIAYCCLNQSAATTAVELIVLITRPDLWKQRAQFNLNCIVNYNPERKSLNGNSAINYYKKLMPFLYFNDFFGLTGLFRKTIQFFHGMIKPTVREVSKSDIRVVLHKSAALAAQTFMLSMASEKQDTCPIEGFDSKRLKKLLNLNRRTEVCMVIACGKRAEGGIYNPRFRVEKEKMIVNFS